MTERLSELEAGDDYDGVESNREQLFSNAIAWLLPPTPSIHTG